MQLLNNIYLVLPVSNIILDIFIYHSMQVQCLRRNIWTCTIVTDIHAFRIQINNIRSGNHFYEAYNKMNRLMD